MSFLNLSSRRSVTVLCLVALIATSLAQTLAQQPEVTKRPLTPVDYDSWRSIVSPQISRDGKFVAYAYMAQDADSDISYNGEKHGLRKRINQKDYTRRMQEFFDHFLKGAPAPEWMEKGIPYLQRDKEKEKYRVGEQPGQ